MQAEEIRNKCKDFLDAYIFGETLSVNGEEISVQGIRRQRPLEGVVPLGEDGRELDEFPEEAPMPELDGIEVDIEEEDKTEAGVLLDFIPIENAKVTLESSTPPSIFIEFILCDNYPPEKLDQLINPEDFDGKRIVTIPQDSRFHLWVTQCLERLYNYLGDDALKVEFTVDTFTDRFERLVEAELIPT